MDAETFLAAQLWLRPLPAEAWPTTARATTRGEQEGRIPKPVASAGASGSGDGRRCGVILTNATCCFLLESRPSVPAAGVSRRSRSSTDNVRSDMRSDRPRSRRRPRPLLFSTRCTTAAAAAAKENHTCRNSNGKGNSGLGDNRLSQTSCEGPYPQEAKTSRGVQNYSSSCYGFERDNSGAVRVAGKDQQERGRPTATATATPTPTTARVEPGPGRLKRDFDFDLAIARGSSQPPQRNTGNNATGGLGERRGVETGGDWAEEGGDTCHPSADEQGDGGFLLFRIEGKVYEAEHTLIRSIAYPRGGGGRASCGSSDPVQSGRQEDSRRKPSPREAATATDTPAASRRGHDCGAPGAKALPTAGAIDVPPARYPSTASSAAEAAVAAEKKRPIDKSNEDGAAGTTDVGCGGGAGHGIITGGIEERQNGVSKRGRVDTGGDTAAAVGGGVRGGLVDAGVAEAAENKQAQECSYDGDGGAEAGMPFCGLFFPGVMIKFWVREAGCTHRPRGLPLESGSTFAVTTVE